MNFFIFVFVFRRYADFIVNEVDIDGNVVHLTSLDLPPDMVCLASLQFTCCMKLCFVSILFFSLFVPMRCCLLFSGCEAGR